MNKPSYGTTDNHLNLFYSYNQDEELIENNLTRAWIVTLQMLSVKTRSFFLQALFELPLRDLGYYRPSFTAPQFALQGNVEPWLPGQIPQKYIVTIATQRDLESDLIHHGSTVTGNSIPDAWIFDPDQGYCFLIEAKVGNNPLDAKQIYSHATRWLHISPEKIKDQLICLTWYDILAIIHQPSFVTANLQEHLLLEELARYIGFFGYRLFKGFEFIQLQAAPFFSLSGRSYSNVRILDFPMLKEAPTFHLGKAVS